jgi:hypothetical protein
VLGLRGGGYGGDKGAGGLRARLKGKAGDLRGRTRGRQARIMAAVARPMMRGGRKERRRRRCQVGSVRQRKREGAHDWRKRASGERR